MAGAYRRSQQLYGLLREFLTLCYALGGSKRPRGALVVFPLFAIEHSPLGLMAGLQQCPRTFGHASILPSPRRYASIYPDAAARRPPKARYRRWAAPVSLSTISRKTIPKGPSGGGR
jgi:hypothetical protein